MQRNRGPQGLSSEPQGISLGSPPCAPFKDSSRPSARSLGPHSRCNASIFPAFPHPRGLVRESIHPEKREPHGVCFRALGQAWFCPSPATRTPDNDQSRSSAGFFHKQIMPDGSHRELLTHAEAFFASVLRKQESMTTESYEAAGTPSRADAATALVLAHSRNAAISSARVMESGTVSANASRSDGVRSAFFSE